jgi:quinol monooxygenase YgiN
MYARLVRFSFGEGQRSAAQELADDLVPLIASQPGCVSVTGFGDAADGQCGIFVLWDTQANADAAAQLVRPKLDAHLSGKVQQPPETRLFEVFATR